MKTEGSEGGRRRYISHTHIQSCMAIPGKPSARLTPPLRGLTHYPKLITGQRSLRFSILKETPATPMSIAGQPNGRHTLHG
jgi:hypothetical protein